MHRLLAAMIFVASMAAGPIARAEPITLAHAEQWLMRSQEGETYLIQAAVPATPAATGGFPVLYVLDSGPGPEASRR